MTAPAKLDSNERHFLGLIYPTGTIGIGLTVGERLYARGLVSIVKRDRYGITPEGARAIEQYPESLMTVGGDQ